MYINSKATLAVKVGNELSESFKSEIGLFQGDVLSPALFNLYLNDLMKSFDESNDPAKLDNCSVSALIYADDIVLISTSKEGLLKSVNSLSEYCGCWDLTLNTEKKQYSCF